MFCALSICERLTNGNSQKNQNQKQQQQQQQQSSTLHSCLTSAHFSVFILSAGTPYHIVKERLRSLSLVHLTNVLDRLEEMSW